MSIKNKLLICASIVFAITLISGASILAATNSGTQSDPLVTLGYLTNIFKPKVIEELETQTEVLIQDMSADFDMKMTELAAELESSPSGGDTQAEKPITAHVVTLSKGQTLVCSVGAELMLRIGEATGTGSAPALVDSTDGMTISAGTALVTNHMYLVTIEGNGTKAESDTVKILVRGDYWVA